MMNLTMKYDAEMERYLSKYNIFESPNLGIDLQGLFTYVNENNLSDEDITQDLVDKYSVQREPFAS